MSDTAEPSPWLAARTASCRVLPAMAGSRCEAAMAGMAATMAAMAAAMAAMVAIAASAAMAAMPGTAACGSELCRVPAPWRFEKTLCVDSSGQTFFIWAP